MNAGLVFVMLYTQRVFAPLHRRDAIVMRWPMALALIFFPLIALYGQKHVYALNPRERARNVVDNMVRNYSMFLAVELTLAGLLTLTVVDPSLSLSVFLIVMLLPMAGLYVVARLTVPTLLHRLYRQLGLEPSLTT